MPLRILRTRIKLGLQPPTAFATVVTDLTTCHNTWFYPAVDRCYVATEASRQQALRLGLLPRQIRMYGLPIRPAFSKRYPPKRQLRKALGMDLAKPAVLLVGGGEGMGPVEKTVDSLVQVRRGGGGVDGHGCLGGACPAEGALGLEPRTGICVGSLGCQQLNSPAWAD